MKVALNIIVFFCTIVSSFGQELLNVKFGEISKNDLLVKSYPIDTNANSVVLYEKGDVSFFVNNRGFYSIQYNIFKRIHILRKAGYDLADVEIPLYYAKGYDERCDHIKAVTYNLENNEVTESHMDNSNVFLEKVDLNHLLKKFTLPNVKEGSIIEYKYTVISDYIHYLEPWSFQSKEVPKLWSEYNISKPEYFDYIVIPRGNQFFLINKKETKTDDDTVNGNAKSVSGSQIGVSRKRKISTWVMKDVPKLKTESLVFCADNFLSGIDFSLDNINSSLSIGKLNNNWHDAIKTLIANEHFGADLSNKNNWLSDEIDPLINGRNSPLANAQALYNYVRDNYKCLGKPQYIYMSQTLKNTAKNHSGSVAEINLLFTAMLKHAGIEVEPVILSTADHGYVFPLYPILSKFNYVIARVRMNNTYYYLDATKPLKFGILPKECYNGHAVVVDENATPISFSADSITDKCISATYITFDSGAGWQR